MEPTAFYNRLDSYEQGIYEDLIHFCGCDPRAAESILIEYAAVLKELGRVDDTLTQADRLTRARKNGYTAALWLKTIDNYRGS